MQFRKNIIKITFILSLLLTLSSIVCSIVVPIFSKKIYFIFIFILLIITFGIISIFYYNIIKILNKNHITKYNKIKNICSNVSLILIMISFTMIIVFLYFIVLYRAFKPFVLIFLAIALISFAYSYSLEQIIKYNKK